MKFPNIIVNAKVLMLCAMFSASAQAGTRIYITHNINRGFVTVVDDATQAVVRELSVGTNPTRLAAAPDGRRVYVSNFRSHDVSVIDTSTDSVVATIPVGRQPESMAVTPDGVKLYVINYAAATLSVVDTASHSVSTVLPIGVNAKGVEVSPDGRWVYVANRGSGSVSVIDAYTDEVYTTITGTGGGNRIIFTRDSSKAYVVTGAGVTVIDVATHTVLRKLAVGLKPVDGVMAHGAGRLFVGNVDGHSISVIDTTVDLVVDTITGIGRAPWRLQVSRDESTVYAACSQSDQLSIIDVATQSVRENVSVGDGAFYVEVNPDNTRVYTTNPPAFTASVVNVDAGATPPTQSVQTLATEWNPWAMMAVTVPD